MDASELADLAAALNSHDRSARFAAAQRAALLGEEGAPLAVPLVRALAHADDDEELRESIVAALEDLGAPPTADLQALAELLESLSGDAAYWGATLLGRAGPSAAGQVAALVSATNPPAAVHVAERAVWALGRIGPAAIAALPRLRELAEVQNPRISRLSQQAIASIEQR